MRLGLFVALLAGIAVVVTLSFPLTGFMGSVSDDAPPIPPAPRCFVLTHPPSAESPYLPQHAQLLPDSGAGEFLGSRWHRGAVTPALFGDAYVAWRPVGADSVDIVWTHDSAVMRIPAHREGVGRIVERGYVSLFDAVLRRELAVHARPVSCVAS